MLPFDCAVLSFCCRLSAPVLVSCGSVSFPFWLCLPYCGLLCVRAVIVSQHLLYRKECKPSQRLRGDATKISFILPEENHVRLDILDIFGNVVKTIFDDFLPATEHSFDWDRSDEIGQRCANGTYIYRLTAGEVVKTGKMTIVD